MRTHELKSWTPFFVQLLAGTRTHELRRNDRGYAIGDRLVLREYDQTAGAYTGRTLTVAVTSMTSLSEPCAVSGDGLHPNFCILSVQRVDAATPRQSLEIGGGTSR